jgi:hypothetical protein
LKKKNPAVSIDKVSEDLIKIFINLRNHPNIKNIIYQMIIDNLINNKSKLNELDTFNTTLFDQFQNKKDYRDEANDAAEISNAADKKVYDARRSKLAADATTDDVEKASANSLLEKATKAAECANDEYIRQQALYEQSNSTFCKMYESFFLHPYIESFKQIYKELSQEIIIKEDLNIYIEEEVVSDSTKYSSISSFDADDFEESDDGSASGSTSSSSSASTH